MRREFISRTLASPLGLTAAATVGAPQAGSASIFLDSFGAAGDGNSDDYPVLKSAVEHLSKGGGGSIVLSNKSYKFVVPNAGSSIILSKNISIHGNGARFLIDAGGGAPSDDHWTFFKVSGDDVSLSGFDICRINTGAKFVLFYIGPISKCSFSSIAFDGRVGSSSGSYCHGLKFGDVGHTSGISFARCRFRQMTYPMLMTNAARGIVRDVKFEGCEFENNWADDVGLNAPKGKIEDVFIGRSSFKNNNSASPSGGFAIALSNVCNAVVIGCKIDGYDNEAVHIEDYSCNVSLLNNSISHCGRVRGSYIRIISGSRNIKIHGNRFLRPNNSNINVIEALTGGVGLAPSGRPAIPPNGISIDKNIFEYGLCRYYLYIETVMSYKISDNKFICASGREVYPRSGNAFEILLFRSPSGYLRNNSTCRNGKQAAAPAIIRK